MKLAEIASARSGDKGDTCNVALFVETDADFERVRAAVTAERVKSHFGELVRGEVVRHELPRLGALNFVLHGALAGGVTRSLALDAHGKSLSSALLELELSPVDAV